MFYICGMKTVNSLSGGKTSSYIAVHYPADYNVFALIRTSDKNCMFPDKKIRQEVSDRIGTEFIGTLEDDVIIYTMLDLEQMIGRKIDWITGKTFDDVILQKGGGKTYLPQSNMRFCTTEMKLKPMKEWWYKNIREVCEMRIGFRANEMNRGKTMLDKQNVNGFLEDKFVIGKSAGGRNKWKNLEWQTARFPLIEDAIFKDKIESFWKGKPVRFAWINNCVGCMGATPFYIKHQYKKNKNKIEWFIKQEKKFLKDYGRTWKINGLSIEDMLKYKEQIELFDEDFNSCDSGGCGL